MTAPTRSPSMCTSESDLRNTSEPRTGQYYLELCLKLGARQMLILQTSKLSSRIGSVRRFLPSEPSAQCNFFGVTPRE